MLIDPNEEQFIKEGTTVVFNEKIIGDCVLHYRIRTNSVPRWYKNFFNQEDIEINGEALSGYFDKTIVYKQKFYKFVISLP